MVSSARDPLVGRRLGEFVLRERIGEGGFGKVYRAIQPGLDREAVIKVLHAQLRASPSSIDRFLREAKLASKLDHPYAAHVYAFGAEPDGELWIAMELVRGTPLDRLLEIQGPLPLERLVGLLDRISEVVHTAHEQGIVHRDLKPANVMVLSRAGRMLPKLLDFGIAKAMVAAHDPGTDRTLDLASTLDASLDHTISGGGGDAKLTQRGAIMGSPHYMAPEQWLDAGGVDARTDIYALAILAFQALVGRVPFSGATITELAKAHAQGRPPPVGGTFPIALDRVFAKALAKEASDRYPDILAFAAAFRDAAGITAEGPRLPALDPALRDRVTIGAPQPIAEAVAALQTARNPHQARDSIGQLVRTIVRYLGLLALAARSRVIGRQDSPAIADAMRELYRRSLTDREWLVLGRELTRDWLDRRDAHPIPELVAVFHDDTGAASALETLTRLREREPPAETELIALLEEALGHVARVLERLAFLGEYTLVVASGGAVAENWMGARRTSRATTALRGKSVPAGSAALLDEDGVPVLVLAPLFQIAPPTPGSPLELFLFEGRDARGARFVSLPTGFEHHDDALWDWFRGQLSHSVDEADAQTRDEKAPYRGLSAFSADDETMFFGREALVDAAVNRLRLQPLLVVVGRSGAGKSSFVQAGVIPALPAGWRSITIRPGSSPLASLVVRLDQAGIAPGEEIADRLRRDAAERGPLLLVVDQLEEMFTLCSDEAERQQFAEAIAASARTAEDPVRVIVTLRDDFLVRAEQLVALRNRIAHGLQLLTVPAAEDLLRIVSEPARRVGYEFEDAALPREIVDEVADQPGALALISFTAEKLWELRDRHFKQLTRAAYKTLGGVGGALARHAELTLQAMLPDEQALTRQAFRHLVTTQGTRTVLQRSELMELLGGAHADRVIEKLVAARLLVASENERGAETIELIHEALLVAWPRLGEWRREDADGTRFREQLRAAANQWDERKRGGGLLWRGDALAELTRWRSRHAQPLTEIETAFAAASQADALRGRRNRRALYASVCGVLVLVVIGLVVFTTRLKGQREQLRDNVQRQYETQGRRLVLDGDPLLGLAYLAKASDLGASGRAHDFLIAEALRDTGGERFEIADADMHAARLSHDGTRVVTATDRGATIWDSAGRALHVLPHDKPVISVELSPDDALVLTASEDATAVLWNTASGEPAHRLRHAAVVQCAKFSKDGALVVTTSADDTVAVWDVATGAKVFSLVVAGLDSGTHECAFSADATLVAVGLADGSIRVIASRTGTPLRDLRGEPGGLHALQFAPVGTRLVTANLDRMAVEWDAATGERLHVLALGGNVKMASFSPDGRAIVTASEEDHAAVIWDAESGAKLHVLAGHTAGVLAAAFSPDGKYVVTTSDDASAQLWEASSGRRVARWPGHRSSVQDLNFDTRGDRVLTYGTDARAIAWLVAPQERVVWLDGHTDDIQSVRFSPDGARVITGGAQGSARVWDAQTGDAIFVLPVVGETSDNRTRWVNDVAFSPDGKTIATASGDGNVKLWDSTTGTLRSTWGSKSTVASVAWSPDGTLLAAALLDTGVIRCWRVASGAVQFELSHKGAVSIAFDATGARLVSTGLDEVVRIWDRDGRRIAEHAQLGLDATFDRSGTRLLSIGKLAATIWDPSTGDRQVELLGHSGFVLTASWSPDASFVLTAALDGTARIWDVRSGDALAIYHHPNNVRVAAYSPDGRRIAVGDDNGTAAIHDLPQLPPHPERAIACQTPFEIQNERPVPRTTACDR